MLFGAEEYEEGGTKIADVVSWRSPVAIGDLVSTWTCKDGAYTILSSCSKSTAGSDALLDNRLRILLVQPAARPLRSRHMSLEVQRTPYGAGPMVVVFVRKAVLKVVDIPRSIVRCCDCCTNSETKWDGLCRCWRLSRRLDARWVAGTDRRSLQKVQCRPLHRSGLHYQHLHFTCLRLQSGILP